MRVPLAVCLLLASLGAAADGANLPWRDVDTEPPAAADGLRLLYFTADWCGPCRLLAREVFDHPGGQQELARFDRVRVDIDTAAGARLARRYDVGTVPTFVVVEGDGDELGRVRGYRSRRLLLRDLSRIRSRRGTLADLQRRLALSPGEPRLQAALGLRHLGRLELLEAAPLLEAGLDRAGALGDTLAAEAGRGLADLHRRRGDDARAARALEILLRDHPRHVYPRATWTLLAECRAALGDSVAAVRALGEAALIEPRQPDALVAFAQAAARTRSSLPEAEEAARQAVTMTERGDPAAQAALAAVLRRRGRYAEALMWIKRAVALAPDEEGWQAQLAEIERAAITGD